MAREFFNLIKSFENILDPTMSLLMNTDTIPKSIENQVKYVFNKAGINHKMKYTIIKEDLRFNDRRYYFVSYEDLDDTSNYQKMGISFIGNVIDRKSVILVIPFNWEKISSDKEKYDTIYKFIVLLLNNSDVIIDENLPILLTLEILINSQIKLSEELINSICNENSLDYEKIIKLHIKYDNSKLFDMNYYLLEDIKK